MKTAWVIKNAAGKYVDTSGTDYTDDIHKAYIFDAEMDAVNDIDGTDTGDEHAVQVRIGIEEVA